MENNNPQPVNIFAKILEGVKVNNEILVGLATDIEIIKEQQKLILIALYPPDENTENTEPTALGSDTSSQS